uniref:Uncharacterized protein n=1 Tax=Arundo donax TaxID=35708 RepID=A0A0A9CPH3_ARUDO
MRPRPRLRPSAIGTAPHQVSSSTATAPRPPTASLRCGPIRRRLRLPRGRVVLWRPFPGNPSHRSPTAFDTLRRRPPSLPASTPPCATARGEHGHGFTPTRQPHLQHPGPQVSITGDVEPTAGNPHHLVSRIRRCWRIDGCKVKT